MDKAGEHGRLNVTFHSVPGTQLRAFVIETEDAPARQSVVYGGFDSVTEIPTPIGSIVHLCYLENTPCLVGKGEETLLVGDYNNSIICATAMRHNAPLLDVLLLSIDEGDVFKTQIGFDRLKEGCLVIAHEPRRIILSRIEDGRLVERLRLDNSFYLPQAFNLIGNGDVFSGHLLVFLQNHSVRGHQSMRQSSTMPFAMRKSELPRGLNAELKS